MEKEFSSIFLRREYQKRFEKNPLYSLRAFAKSLGMSHTVLSLVINGKRRLSKKAVFKITDHFGLDPATQAKLLNHEEKMTYNYKQDYEQMNLDMFSVIADWENYGILSLLEIPNSKFESQWIAKRLGITLFQAKAAMERLLRLGLIEKQKNKRYKQSGKPIKIDNKISTPITRKFQKQVLEKAIASIENDPAEMRDITSITFAMNPEDISWAQLKIREFRRHLCEELEKKGKPKEVYNLSVQLYPLTKKIDGENK
ncbi:MAG: TIGR02147 family protein [Oligoflexia bacterium]|nr:TIGR02147 family protein [Oligoflexia bacterium]